MWLKYRWWIISGGAALLLMAGWMTISNLIAYERSLALAEEKERQVKLLASQQEDSQKRFEAYVQESQRQMQAMAQQQATLAQSMAARAQTYQGQVQTIQKATTTEDIIRQMKDFLQVTATSTTPGMVTLPAAQAQNFVILDIENKKLKADVEDLRKQFGIERQKTANLQESLDRALLRIGEEHSLAEGWKGVADSYKVAAKKTKLRRFLDFAKPLALSVAAGVIAGQVAK